MVHFHWIAWKLLRPITTCCSHYPSQFINVIHCTAYATAARALRSTVCSENHKKSTWHAFMPCDPFLTFVRPCECSMSWRKGNRPCLVIRFSLLILRNTTCFVFLCCDASHNFGLHFWMPTLRCEIHFLFSLWLCGLVPAYAAPLWQNSVVPVEDPFSNYSSAPFLFV